MWWRRRLLRIGGELRGGEEGGFFTLSNDGKAAKFPGARGVDVAGVADAKDEKASKFEEGGAVIAPFGAALN